MLIFQDLNVQIAPRLKLFFEGPHPDSSPDEILHLQKNCRVTCTIQCYEEGMEPLSYYEAELDGDHCGIVAVDDARMDCRIILFVAKDKIEFFMNAMSVFATRPYSVRVTIIPSPKFSVSRGCRIYRVEQGPMITISSADAA